MHNLIILRPKPSQAKPSQAKPSQANPARPAATSSNGGLMPEPLCAILLAPLQGPALPVEGRDE